jgi:hypothetical protein
MKKRTGMRSPVVDLGVVPSDRDIREEDGLAFGTALVHSQPGLKDHQVACVHIGNPAMDAEAGAYAVGKGEYYLMIADTEWPTLREQIDAVFAARD